MQPPLYFSALVERIHAVHHAAGREVSKEDVITIARATLRAVGVHVDSTSGQIHTGMRADPARQTGVHFKGQQRRGRYRR